MDVRGSAFRMPRFCALARICLAFVHSLVFDALTLFLFYFFPGV
jgi:hypothetical protein